jgi:transposase
MSTSICVVDADGMVIVEQSVDSDPDSIADFVHINALGVQRVGLEPGPTSMWLWRELAKRGLPVICIDARHARAALSMQINKSDRNDAAGIARIMQTGWYREVQIKSPVSHATRALLNRIGRRLAYSIVESTYCGERPVPGRYLPILIT